MLHVENPTAAASLVLLALAAAGCSSGRAGPPASAAAPADAAATALLDERFERARAIPALATYEALSLDLLERLEQAGRWHLVLDRASEATAEVVDGSAVLRITRAGDRWYSVQLAYLPVRLRPGRTYRVTFQASADRPIVTTFDLAHVGGGWHSYSGRRELALGRAPRRYELQFRTGARDAEERSRFEFNFGDEGPAVVRFDEVRIVEEAPAGP